MTTYLHLGEGCERPQSPPTSCDAAQPPHHTTPVPSAAPAYTAYCCRVKAAARKASRFPLPLQPGGRGVRGRRHAGLQPQRGEDLQPERRQEPPGGERGAAPQGPPPAVRGPRPAVTPRAAGPRAARIFGVMFRPKAASKPGLTLLCGTGRMFI